MITETDVEDWLQSEGRKFLRKIGLKSGDRVVDFGCGSGNYGMPAAQAIGEGGRMYAVEEDEKLLIKLKERARLEGLENITTLSSCGQVEIDIPANSIDVILAYDVLHYFPLDGRRKLYREFHRILRKGGLLSVYPKHNRDDFPLRELAHLTLEQVIAEISEAKFLLREIHFERLIHDDSYERGYILNFRPITCSAPRMMKTPS